MLYTKPKDMKFTDLAIWIDNNVYREDLTEEDKNTLFQYLYHLALMLARKGNYFNQTAYYDDFAIYFATNVYFRLLNPKQLEIDEDTNSPKLTKIKSVLNYMKNIAYLRKIEFEQEAYSQVLSKSEPVAADVVYDTNYTFSDKLSESMDDITMTDFNLCLGDICLTVKNFISKLPYKSDKLVLTNIYLSCLLTLLNTFTLSARERNRVDNLKYSIQNRPKAVAALFKDEPENLVVLYHLDKNMRDYIWVLVQEIKRLISKDLSLTLRTFVPTGSTINAIAMADINLEEYNEYGD